MKAKFVIKILLFAVIVVSIWTLLTYTLTFQDANYDRIRKYYVDTEEVNFDIIYLGSSHIYSNIDTKLIEDKTGYNVYSISTSSQKMSQNYYLLREAMKYDDIKVVVLEMYSLYNKKPHNTQIKSRIASKMRWSKNKVDYLINVFGYPDIFYFFVPLLRYHNNFSNEELIANNLERFAEDAIDNDNYYHGYSPNEAVMTEKLFKRNLRSPSKNKLYYSVTPIEYDEYENELEYLFKTISLCQENNIEVILLKTPVISYVGNIADYSDYYADVVSGIANEYGINMIDYNFLAFKLGLDHNTFKDAGHLNKAGSRIISEHFANYYNALHDDSVARSENLILSAELTAQGGRGKLALSSDETYGQGYRIRKIYEDINYNKIAVLKKGDIVQNGPDYLPYYFSCVVKNTGNADPESLKMMFNIYNGEAGYDRYQYRTVSHLEKDYYLVTTKLESNIGEYYEVRINSNLPKGVSVEIYDLQLYKAHYCLPL